MNPMEMIRQFNQFKENFKGDPQQEVMRLMQSGKLSQQQLNSLQRQASEFQKMLNNMR